jgi:hypothetical protein
LISATPLSTNRTHGRGIDFHHEQTPLQFGILAGKRRHLAFEVLISKIEGKRFRILPKKSWAASKSISVEVALIWISGITMAQLPPRMPI